MSIFASGCTRKVVQETASPHKLQTPSASVAGKIEVAKLLTALEIQDVLGEPLKEPITSTRDEAGFVISQCYFLLPTPAKSAVLTVTSRGTSGNARSPRQFWMEKFHPREGDSNKGQETEEERRRQTPPEAVAEIGDEAYWVESGSTGALYVLQADRFMRVAIGGSDEKAVRIDKAKKLAQFALKRLPLR